MIINIKPPNYDLAEDWIKYIALLYKDSYNTKRKEDSKRLHNYYNGKHRQELIDTIKSRHGHIDKHPLLTHNILRYSSNLLSTIYDGNIQRSIQNENNDLLEDIYIKNKMMTSVNQSLIFDRMSLIQVVVNINNKKIEYRRYKQFHFDLVKDIYGDMMAYILSDAADDFEKRNWYVYTATNYYRIKNNKLVDNKPNSFGFLPFVLITSEELGFEDYLDPRIEIADNLLELNVIRSNNLYTHKLQAHAQPWFRKTIDSQVGESETEPGSTQNTGTFLPMHSPETGTVLYVDAFGNKEEIGFLSPNVDFSQNIELERFYIDRVCEDIGLPPGSFNFDFRTANPKPALNSLIADKKIKELNSNYEQIFKDAEQELFKIAHEVAIKQLYMPLNNIDPNTFNISFQARAVSLDYMEPEQMILLINKNIFTKAEIRAQIKGITVKQAEDELNNLFGDKNDGNKQQPDGTEDEITRESDGTEDGTSDEE